MTPPLNNGPGERRRLLGGRHGHQLSGAQGAAADLGGHPRQHAVLLRPAPRRAEVHTALSV